MTFSMAELPDLVEYIKYKERDSLTFDDESSTTLVHADFYQKELSGRTVSVGMFTHHGAPLFCAWGYKDEEHCSMHAVMSEKGQWLTPVAGCPIKIAIKKDGENIGLQMPTPAGDRLFLFV